MDNRLRDDYRAGKKPLPAPGMTRAHRMDMPDYIKYEFEWPPRMEVLEEALQTETKYKGQRGTLDSVSIPDWKLKHRLGIYSPTPQWNFGNWPVRKEMWEKLSWMNKQVKRYYKKQHRKEMALAGADQRYLPNANDRLTLAGTPMLGTFGTFNQEKDMWNHLNKINFDDLMKAVNDQTAIRLGINSKEAMINWPTGYQRSTVRNFQDLAGRCDVICEVRDARLPWTSAHPDIPMWCKSRPRIVVLTHADLVPPQALADTLRYMAESEEERGIPVIPVNCHGKALSKIQKDVENLRYEILKAGAYVNRRRARKGINPRAVRVMMSGLPNTGKSSVINSLCGRRVEERTPHAGCTRSPRWHRIGGFRNTELEFLDMPGLIPENFGKRYTEEEAAKLCMLRMFGRKVIDREKTGQQLIFHLAKLAQDFPQLVESTVWSETWRKYGVDFRAAARHEAPYLPESLSLKNAENFCGEVLAGFYHGDWGRVQLEPPPVTEDQREVWKSVVQREADRAMGNEVEDGGSDIVLAPKKTKALPPGRRSVVTIPGRRVDRDTLALLKKNDQKKVKRRQAITIPRDIAMEARRTRTRVPALVTAKGYGEDGDGGLFDGW
jgi:ribosome biogenesis GTPase A